MKGMEYVVLREFLDRFDNMRHCRPGEQHSPPNEERAKQLLEQGFIAVVEEEGTGPKGSEAEKPRKGKRQKAAVNDGDHDGGQTDESEEV